MIETALIPAAFIFGLVVGVLGTVIYWPWVEPHIPDLKEPPMTAPDLWPTKDTVTEAAACGKGFWNTCSGCHESNEGYPTGLYHPVLQCHVGGGCFECGGIGAVWDTTDYAAMGDCLAQEVRAPAEALSSAAIQAQDGLMWAKYHLKRHNVISTNVEIALDELDSALRAIGEPRNG